MRLAPLFTLLLVVAASPAAGASPLAAPSTPTAAPDDPPLADAGLDRSVDVGEPVLLDAGGSFDPDGEVTAYEWRVEAPDGDAVAPVDPTAETTRFTPAAAGRYTVTLAVTDDDGATRTDSLYVHARTRPTAAPAGADNRPPTDRIAGPNAVTRGDSARFRANATDPDGRVVSYRWETGATGPVATGRRPTLTFDRAGNVTLSVTVTDDDGGTTRLNDTVEVVESNATGDARGAVRPGRRNAVPDPVVDGPTRVAVGETATYTLYANDPDGSVVRYAWDGTGSTGRTLTRTFTDPGTYTVRGSVVDDDGGTDSAATSVEVYADGEPAASLSGPDAAPAGSVRTYRVEAFDPDGGGVRVSWSTAAAAGTDSGSRFERRVRIPDDPGSTVTVAATVTDDEGNRVTVETPVAVTDGAGALYVANGSARRRIDGSPQTSVADTIEVGSYDFNACVAGDAYGRVTATWEFGDGAVKTQSLSRTDGRLCSSLLHVFGSEDGGRVYHPVSVTFSDATGDTATLRLGKTHRTVMTHRHVNLSASAGRWNATNGTLRVPAGTRVQFGVGSHQSFLVEYGDGTARQFARGPLDTRFSRVYDTPGTYTVQVTTSQGPNGYGRKRVTVRVLPAAGGATPTPG
ncbi:PKD domain-containing protein [Candidatus Halobonum tyrrellensis]|uniref:PKD domain-containing protein n=1 Tax=Candidatus Halobonum tyrrellensis G22 TaxID=1324957 RepID=V4HD77_9EURY|nr:PKD domain-containing protein [Candidatus Halobonum tyrrellensis]ESP88670.1 PKD domain-containing protein [Candidatus Halobonum tyrrellensis G22]